MFITKAKDSFLQKANRLLFVVCLIATGSCVEDKMPPPMATLLNEPGLITHDTTLPAGKLFSIGIEALAGKEPLTNITIKSSSPVFVTFFNPKIIFLKNSDIRVRYLLFGCPGVKFAPCSFAERITRQAPRVSK